jgi:murein DD-endopeptidase MepM/ murein hydrolase activator NlpD
MFGAEDFTDFIYRTAVTEQLSSYNKELINEYNKKIDENKKKTEELDKQKNELAKKQKELEAQYSDLGSSLAEMADIKVSLEDAIKMNEDLIKEYEKLGCKNDEEFSTCVARLNTLPPDTAFWRPLNAGRISSRFGYRTLNGSGDNHEGLDIATPIGTPVYSIANGVVVATYAVGGTGNAVYVRHNVNGRHYTSIYMHLSRYNVKMNDVVTKDSIVGYSGCTGQCYGAHLHLGLLTGHAGVRGDNSADFRFWSSAFYANLIDPASVVNFPSGYKSFSDRTSYYK